MDAFGTIFGVDFDHFDKGIKVLMRPLRMQVSQSLDKTFDCKRRLAFPCQIVRRTFLYMPCNNAPRATLDMSLARTLQFSIVCVLQWQSTIFQSRNMFLITEHMLCAQKTSVDRSPRNGKAFHENKFYVLVIGYVLHSQGTTLDSSMCIWRISFCGVIVLACK